MWDEIKFKVLHSGSKLNLLIGINVAVFLVLGLIGIFETLSTANHIVHQTIQSYLTLSSYLPTLLTRFWTPFSFMFMNEGIITFIFNMLWFYWMGKIFEEYLGAKKLVTLYIFGGLLGAVFFIVAFNVFPLFAAIKNTATAVGAAGSVMAIIVGTATLLPDYTLFMLFIGPVKLKWLAAVYVLIDLFMTTGPDPGDAFVHLGGALMGFIYIRQLKKGNNMGQWVEKLFKPRPKLKIASRNLKNTDSKPRQEEIDRILDKISVMGYDSLSKQEKETLFRASNDDKS